MQLYLIQHGEAYRKEENPERPLTPKGLKDIQQLGELLNLSDIKIDTILHSVKLRAQQTAEEINQCIEGHISIEISNQINPKDPPLEFISTLEKINSNLLIVSHLPFLAKLVSYLIMGQEEPITIAFKPGSVVCLEQTEDKKWLIAWMIRPELLN